jgi:hypothetical protein
MVLGDVKDDRACLEQGKVALLVGRNQAKGMNAQMRRLVPRFERDKANLVGWPTSSSAHRTRVSRARPVPPSGDRSKAEMTIVIARLLSAASYA